MGKKEDLDAVVAKLQKTLDQYRKKPPSSEKGLRALVAARTTINDILGEAEGGAGPPGLPKADAQGNYPAAEYVRARIAQEVRRRREAAGYTQAQLAARAGVRLETINRLEKGRHSSTVTTMEKIERALTQAETAPRAAREPILKNVVNAKRRAKRPGRSRGGVGQRSLEEVRDR